MTLIVLIVVLTFAGGGYAVMERLNDARYLSKVKRTLMFTLNFIAGLVLFFVAIMASIVGISGFSIYAIVRGIKMIKWSKEAEKEAERPAHLESASPKRLRTSGVMLIALTLLVLGYSIINIGDVANTFYKNRAYAGALNADAKNAYSAAMAYFKDNPKAVAVTCEEIEKEGYKPFNKDFTCFSDMTRSSGGIRITRANSWTVKLTKPTAVISHSGELTQAEP